MRRPILAANWKMQKTRAEAAEFVEGLLPLIAGSRAVDVVIAPPFTALDRVAEALRGSGVALAAQNVNPEEKGAFTGEVAPHMLADLGCTYAIVGHSERRALYGESDAFVASKAGALLARDIHPIVCVGESLEEREAGLQRLTSATVADVDRWLAGLRERKNEEGRPVTNEKQYEAVVVVVGWRRDGGCRIKASVHSPKGRVSSKLRNEVEVLKLKCVFPQLFPYQIAPIPFLCERQVDSPDSR